MSVIDRFANEYAFLSNFSPSTVTYEGTSFPTVEHAFQAAKTLDRGERAWIASLTSPGAAKRFGRKTGLRPDWEDVKFTIMTRLVLQKFRRHPALAAQLLATGEATLIEGNTWNDTTWGICQGQGTNWLGIILMAVRDALKETTT